MDVQTVMSHRISGKVRAEFVVHGIGSRGGSGVFNIATEAKKLFAQMYKTDQEIIFESSDGKGKFEKMSDFPKGEANTFSLE